MIDETSSTLKVNYYYDGSLPLAEKVDGKIKQIYINDGEGILGFVRYIYNDSGVFSHYQRLYYLYDSLGSVSYITGENGLPLQNYTYSPYGTCLNVTDDPINNLQFVGRYGGYKDNDSGLTYFWHRWYDSSDGRWVSRDRIGILGDINLFRYAENRPTFLIDVTGYLYEDKCDKQVAECMEKCHREFNECFRNNKCYGNPYKGLRLEGCINEYTKKRNDCYVILDKCKKSIGKSMFWIKP